MHNFEFELKNVLKRSLPQYLIKFAEDYVIDLGRVNGNFILNFKTNYYEHK